MARCGRKVCWRSAALICLLCFAIPVITQDVQATAATATTSGEGVIAGAAEGQKGQALDDAIEANSEAQDYNEETLPVTAQIVKEEPAIEIASGTGDIDTTGDCKAEVDQYCFEIKPGEGRLAKCLQQQLEEQAKAANSDPKITEACKQELDDFLIDRSDNINADIPLAKACVGDADKLCKTLDAGTTVLGCLRERKDELSSECKSEVFERQVVAANDWRTDPELFNACENDALKVCTNVDDHDGKMQICLKEHKNALSWDCQEELFRQDVENADDVRLSVRLFKACLGDKKKFCPDVQPGNARAKECLEEHREDTGFSPQCKTEIEKMMSERAADFRLDAKLRQLCSDDIDEICPYDKESLENVAGEEARVIECLQDYRDEITNEGCRARVNQVMEYASSDIRFDVPLANACYEDRQDFCANVPPGSARVIRCLQERREDLSYECKATLFDQEVNMSENIDFQFPVKKACGTAINSFCKNIPHGHARVIRCLQENVDNSAMPKVCKDQITEYNTKTSTDYRLNYRLTVACQDTIQDKCADACSSSSIEQPCGGTVLRCLTDKVEEISNEDCRKEVVYFQKMEVQDFRNDVILAETCRNDVDQFCSDVQAGEGRVHKCLWDNKDKISKQCRAQEIKSQIMQSSNTELMPTLAKACKAERSAHCKGVRPGKSRVYNCLLTNSDSVDFSVACKEQLIAQQAKRVRDYRMDYDLRIGCKNDVPKVCAGEFKEEDKETGAVLTCLVKNVNSVSDGCSREISRSVRGTLKLFQPGLPVVGVCDQDVRDKCMADKQPVSHAVGDIRKCLKRYIQVPTPPGLSKRRALQEAETKDEAPKGSLKPECKALVELAEPGDAFTAFTASMNASAIASSFKSIEHSLGFKEGTLTPRDSSSALTLTGWTAVLGVLALIAVIIGGVVVGYRRYYGLDGPKGYIKVVKGKSNAPSGL